MRALFRSLLHRHEPPIDWTSNVEAGIGALIGMVAVGGLASVSGLHLLIAPLGATAVLLFGQPSSPLSQPINVMLGYLIGTLACEIAFFVFPGDWLAAGVAVGLTIVAMRAARVTHPPAGAMPIFGLSGALHGMELFVTLFVSCVMLIVLAIVAHGLSPKRHYPKRD